MNSLDIIKTKIQKLYKSNPHIHINVAMTKQKEEEYGLKDAGL